MLEKILKGPKIHYTELGPSDPDSPNARAHETYCREVALLICEGHQGKFVLIHDEEIVGLYDTWDEARREGLDRYLVAGEAFLIRHVLEYEPTLKLNPRIAAMLKPRSANEPKELNA